MYVDRASPMLCLDNWVNYQQLLYNFVKKKKRYLESEFVGSV